MRAKIIDKTYWKIGSLSCLIYKKVLSKACIYNNVHKSLLLGVRKVSAFFLTTPDFPCFLIH